LRPGVLLRDHRTPRRNEAALQILKELEQRYDRHYSIGHNVALVYGGLEEKGQAFCLARKTFNQQSGLLHEITRRLNIEDRRSDPRYLDFVHRMGLQHYV